MGLSKSKPREKKVEEPKKSPTSIVVKTKEKVMETKQLDKEVMNQPAESLLFGAGISKHSKPSSSSEGRRPEETCHVKASGMGPVPKTNDTADKPDTKQKSIKKKSVIPQIIITRASNETIISNGLLESEEQRTIREQADWGPYSRHRSPSTVAAYDVHNTE